MTSPAPRPSILEIEPYVPGESRLPAGLTPIKLSSNETPLGPSPKAVAAFKATAGELERYPDGGATRRGTRLETASPISRGSRTFHTFVFPRPPTPLTSSTEPDASSAVRARR